MYIYIHTRQNKSRVNTIPKFFRHYAQVSMKKVFPLQLYIYIYISYTVAEQQWTYKRNVI